MSKEAKMMVTYGGGSIKKNGILNQVKAELDGIDVIEFGGILDDVARLMELAL